MILEATGVPPTEENKVLEIKDRICKYEVIDRDCVPYCCKLITDRGLPGRGHPPGENGRSPKSDWYTRKLSGYTQWDRVSKL